MIAATVPVVVVEEEADFDKIGISRYQEARVAILYFATVVENAAVAAAVQPLMWTSEHTHLVS